MECRRPNNRRSISSRALVNIVDGAVRGDGVFECEARGWVVGSKVFHDVVFDEGGLGPAIDGEVGVAVGVVIGGEGDGAECNMSVLTIEEECARIYRAAPVAHPFPPTTSPPPDQVMVYVPAAPLV